VLWFTNFDSRYQKYETYVDANSRARNRAPDFHLESFFGQLVHIFVARLPATRDLKLAEPTEVFLAAIRNCKIVGANSLDMHYYQDLGRLDILDITCLQCLVARVLDDKTWAVLDRSGKLARAMEADNDEPAGE
jgi:hypothetical protein